VETKKIYCKPELEIHSIDVEIITTSNGGFGPGQTLPDVDI